MDAGPEAADLDGDGVVGLGDLQVLRSSYGLGRHQAGFEPRADLNGDSVVNIVDLALLARFYGAVVEAYKAKAIAGRCVIDEPGTYVLSSDLLSASTCIVVEADNVVIDGRGFTIKGSGEGYGIYARGVENLTVKDLKVSGWRTGIYLEDVRNVVLKDIVAEENKEDGVSINLFFNATVKNCRLSRNGGRGLSAIGTHVELPEKPEEMSMPEEFSEKLVVIDCRAEDNGIDGFFTLAVRGFTFINCFEQSCDGGIYPFFSVNGVIENCTTNHNIHVGICLCRCVTVTIKNCTAIGNAGGIRMESCNITVEGCTLRNNGDGIFLKYSTNVVVHDNLLENNSYGIHLVQSSDNIIEGNQFLSNEIRDIYVES